jgi:hypothetical protein
MIRELEPALDALRSILVQAKAQAYESGDKRLGDLLNDAEMLPEYIASPDDMTDEFREMLAGIAQTNPSYTHIRDAFERAAVASK